MRSNSNDYAAIENNQRGFVSFVAFVILLIVYVTESNKNHKFLGNLSVEKASDYRESKDHFVLYLRGFESDVYNYRNIGKTDFSEDVLSTIVKKGLGVQLCAIGMTKEVNCPVGGKRLYVDDDSWEKEVLELMNKADKIVYLVNDRDSCIWEIKKSKEVYDKCVFVVDDLAKYNNAKNALKGLVDLPEIPMSEYEDLPLEYDTRRYYFTSDNVLKPFGGKISDYCEMLGISADSISEADIKESRPKPFYKMPFFKLLWILLALKLFLALIAMILNMGPRTTFNI